ncbi:transcriptional regulator [Roseibium aggregatum]|uniref:winged helix-turn-helix domain-containing tetratricopeptide repeat protein n=1 Tax=Roseibium aggregatum TaxID=187304 RepID=UPI001E391186|nr:winged helix-turn-helix domain-containing protein [Roseibium aggregatum]UES54287.1 transcriptional regulator [Roseibium aggregatum]
MPQADALVFTFDGFELDGTRFELRRDGERVAIEPQVLSLLLLLVENRDRMVSKDELIEHVWDGRIVSETAVAARIKAARKAVGDKGSTQKIIRTIHGKGFRFVAETEVSGVQAKAPPAHSGLITEEQAAPAIEEALKTARDGRPSIAVLPFQYFGEPGQHEIVADALPADIIADLSRLHWLFVIARGSSFRFRGPDVDPLSAGRQLGVRYGLTGTVELAGESVTIGVSLIDMTSSGTIWAEHYRGSLSELQQLRPEIESHVVASLAVQIPQNEVRIARRRAPGELDAWACFHLGLDHMYRFNRQDNARASELFTRSLERDSYFSGAMGGLSFTHFQSAFMRFAEDPEAEVEKARALAQQAVETDRLDPFAHFNAGRCSWLDGRLEDSIAWFDRATSLSPSFAQGVYTRGLVSVMAGQAAQADADLALALDLSPLDPLAYGMVSARALVQLQLGDRHRAAELAVKAAQMPGAHKHISLIAALTSHLVGKNAEARQWLARARQADPEISSEVFFASFPFAENGARETIEKGLRELGV